MLTQLRNIARYNYALRNFVARELKVMYSNSALGIVWSLFNPLLMMLVFTIVFTVMMPSGIANYPVYLLSGLLPWNFFNAAVLTATGAIINNGHLVNRVYFPREILPLSIILSSAVNFFIALLLLFALILFFQIPLGWSVLWLPVLVLVELALCIGLGLLLSAVNVYFRDTQQIVSVLFLAGFFLTPIVYSYDNIQNALARQWLPVLNPMAALVLCYRQILYTGGPLDLRLFAGAALEAGVLLFFGLWVFRKLSPAFAEEI